MQLSPHIWQPVAQQPDFAAVGVALETTNPTRDAPVSTRKLSSLDMKESFTMTVSE